MANPPAFIDNGIAGTWADLMLHSPCLHISEYSGHRLPDADGACPLSFHDHTTSAEVQQNPNAR